MTLYSNVIPSSGGFDEQTEIYTNRATWPWQHSRMLRLRRLYITPLRSLASTHIISQGSSTAISQYQGHLSVSAAAALHNAQLHWDEHTVRQHLVWGSRWVWGDVYRWVVEEYRSFWAHHQQEGWSCGSREIVRVEIDTRSQPSTSCHKFFMTAPVLARPCIGIIILTTNKSSFSFVTTDWQPLGEQDNSHFYSAEGENPWDDWDAIVEIYECEFEV